MSLHNKTCWVVGGVGVIGRGITRALLNAGATVIVNSRSEKRLLQISDELGNPDKLITINGSLLPGYAAKTVHDTLSSSPPLDHVVAHGAVRFWGGQTGRDETHSIIRSGVTGGGFLDTEPQDFTIAASHLASLHYSAAQQLVPHLRHSDGVSSYTFVTGDAGGHPGGRRSAVGELNAHHVWGLSAALRRLDIAKTEFGGEDVINCRELRVKMAVNRPDEERAADPRPRPLSVDIGSLCAGLAMNPTGMSDRGDLIEVSQDTLTPLLEKYTYGFFEHEEEDKTATV